MGKTILRLMGLILVLQGILTVGLALQWQKDIRFESLMTSKESVAVLMGIFILMAANAKMGGYDES